MNRIALAAALAGALASAPALAAETYTLDSTHTFPSFEVSHLGYSIQRGRFNKTTGKITLDAAAKKGSAEITIDAASIDTGLAKLEEHLRGDDFFNVAFFPTITFKGDKFAFEGDKVKSVGGTLTLLGVSKPVTLTATHFNCADHPMTKKKACGGDFTTTIKRTDFGMKYGVPAVGDDVTLRIQVEAFKD
ncbi:MAG: polyisoprenoid-binding protein [Betaproteobacteria bacterium]|nr:MAG: polyisoprenoid-binding protein [Betaproteobacteria bacterium]